VVVVLVGFAIEAEARANDGEQHEEGPGGEVGSVVPAADEVGVLFDGAVFDGEPCEVEENSDAVEQVEATPVSCTVADELCEDAEDDDDFSEVEIVVVAVVEEFVWGDVLPAADEVGIEEDPP